MERSDKHGPRQDEALQRETSGLTHAGRSTRSEEWLDPEAPGEDQPEVDLAPDATLAGGVPEGLTAEGVAERSELASYLGRAVYPAYRDQLIDRLVDSHAPERLVSTIAELPADASFANAGELATALGLGHETHRF